MSIIILLPALCTASLKINVKKVRNNNMAKKEEKNADRNREGDA